VHVRRPLTAVCAALALVLAGCGNGADLPAGLRTADSHTSSHASSPSAAATRAAAKDVPLRDGERFQSIRLRAAYTPKAPTGTGTDDYRCFVLDPDFDTDQLVSGVQISPDNAAIVHHVIVSKVEPDQVGTAKALDAKDPGDGYTCFGGAGIAGVAGGNLDDADWVGAWAPGGGERVMADDIGIPLKAGTQLVVQVHYNLLAGTGADRSTVRLRLSEAKGSDRTPLQTMLLPAPVELPCRDGKTSGLCNRTLAVADLKKRFDENPATADLLHLLCGPVQPGSVQSCTRPIRSDATIRAVAGHMHLLGRAITVDVNKGTPKAKRVLDIANWNFDDQGSIPLKKPVNIGPGDTITVTCTHDQGLRDLLPSFRGTTERYVAWGEGTTDEMCLGIVLMTAR
jgi:Copper type II ascorbate-dependent monooxygenase, C-terminal domain